MREIILSNGQTTQVDDVDYLYLNQFNWCLHTKGYAHGRCAKGQVELMHIVIVERMGCSWEQVDHEDRNVLNNQRYNLRESNNSRNQHNQGPDKTNTSGFKGVSYNKSRGDYQAYINVGRQRFHLGYYSTAEEAAVRSETARKRYA